VEPGPADLAYLKAIAHPLRFRLLTELSSRVASPRQLAEALEEPLGRVSHHVRVLARLEAIELVRQERRRGALEHFYRARVRPWLDDDTWARLPVETRRASFAQNVRRIGDDLSRGIEAGALDHPRAHVSSTRLALDELGYTAVADLLGATLDRLVEIEAESRGRLAGAPPRHRTEAVIVHFEHPAGREASTTQEN
jgi:DNA-binding transcriptional ArsR family regulator